MSQSSSTQQQLQGVGLARAVHDSDDSDSNTGDTRWRGKLQTPKTKTPQTKSVYTDNVVPMDLSPDGRSSANKRPFDRS